MKQFTIQDLTFLPVGYIAIPDFIGGALVVTTPHRGKVTINLTETVTLDGLFSKAIEKGDREMDDVMRELKRLEVESANYLAEEWKKTL